MFENYIKIAFRTLWKNRAYMFVNVLGLSIAIACCIVAYLNYDFNEKFDTFHENYESLYRVNLTREAGERTEYWGQTPLALGPAIAQDIPGVINQSRISGADGAIQYEGKTFKENVKFVDPAFLEMFTFDLKIGDPASIHENSSVIISESISTKYFGDENPIGKWLTFMPRDSMEIQLLVGGVFEPVPLNSSLYIDFLASFDIYNSIYNFEGAGWRNNYFFTVLQIEDQKTAAEVEVQLDRYVSIQNESREDFKVSRFYLERMPDWKAKSDSLYGNWLFKSGLHIAAILVPNVMGILILLIACFNFINTSIAAAGRRLNEIGVRKVLGGSQLQLIIQLLGEHIMVCLIALLFGMGLAELLVPLYSQLWPYLDIHLDYQQNFELVLFLVGLLIGVGILAGLYPSVYIARFEPTAIFKGRQVFGSKSMFSQVLMGFQFSLSIMVIICGVAFAQNADFMDTMDYGYDEKGLFVVPNLDKQKYEMLAPKIAQIPQIESYAGTRTHLYIGSPGRNVSHQSTTEHIRLLYAGIDYMDVMNFRLVDGRMFDPNLETDQQGAVLVNKTFLKTMKMQNPIGEKITINSTSFTIIGVVEDFETDAFFDPIDPYVIELVDTESYRQIVMRGDPENIKSIQNQVGKEWATLFPSIPFEGFSNDELMLEAKTISTKSKQLFIFLAIVATLLSLIGLFAMVSLKILRRLKEIGIRKVFGASAFQIVELISKNILWMLLIASIIGAIPSYFGADILLGSIYAVYTPIHFWIFFASIALIMFVAILTLGTKIAMAANTNPATILRDE